MVDSPWALVVVVAGLWAREDVVDNLWALVVVVAGLRSVGTGGRGRQPLGTE